MQPLHHCWIWECKTGSKFYVNARTSGGSNLDRQWKSSQTGTIAWCEFSWNFHAIHSRSSAQSEKRGFGSFLIVVARCTNQRKQKEVPDQLTLKSFRNGNDFTSSYIYYRVLSEGWIKSTAFSNGFVSLVVCIVLIVLAKIMWNRMLACAAHTKSVLFITHGVGVFTLGLNMLQRLPCQC